MDVFKAYHAHLYYEVTDIQKAHALIQKINENFELQIGRVWDRPVGPHPIGSCQVTVTEKDFSIFIPWLMKHRGEIDVFIHACSGDDYLDHTQFVMWLGKSYELKLDIFTDDNKS